MSDMRPNTGTMNCWFITLKSVEPVIGMDGEIEIVHQCTIQYMIGLCVYVIMGTVN